MFKKTFLLLNSSFVRYKNPPHHWSVLKKKVHPVDKALNYFDEFYKEIFNKNWPYIRKALLGKQKYVAVINNFGDDKETMANLELMGALNVRTLFNLEKDYLREEMEKNTRNAALNKIFELDQQMESNSTTVKTKEEEHKPSFSLETDLKTAKFDTDRLVDVRQGVSAGSLAQFIPATKIKGREDFISESAQIDQYFNTNASFNIQTIKEYDVHFPEHLNVYCFEENNNSSFEPPKNSSTGVLNYYLMDGGSILPILALNLKPGDRFLDLCSGPGGKSLLAIQTMYPEYVVSNDVSSSRLNRVRRVYEQFLYDFEEKWLESGRISLSKQDARWFSGDTFDKILVDVPCTTDRHSLHENDNNIFKPSRIKERLNLPELQKTILFNALKLLNKGGVLVYSTCSLNPIQNDGVVRAALKQIWEETNLEIVVKDLSVALLQMRRVYKFADKSLTQHGHLVLPSVSQNYGPTYFCKLQRVS